MFTATRVAAGVAVLVLTGSLALIAGPRQPPTDPSPPAAVSPDPPAESIDGIHVSGRIDFLTMTDPPADFGQTTEEADGSSNLRGARFETRWTADDPRFVGGGETTSNSNTYPADGAGDVTVGWGTQTIVTDQGTWTSRGGNFAIVTDDESVIPAWFVGGGAYEGMSAFLLEEIVPIEGSDSAYWVFEGWIVPSDRHFEDALQE